MSVLIKGMDMPKGCATCPYCDRAWNKPKCKAKSMQGRFMEQRYNLDRTRQKWCPLVPVPPHGRLIDADVALRSEQPSNCSDELWAETTLAQCIINAPTIIEAEGKDNG